MSIEEGMTHVEAPQKGPGRRQKGLGRRQEVQSSQKPPEEVEGGEAGPLETTAPLARKRAPPKCSLCNSLEHTARTCPCK